MAYSMKIIDLTIVQTKSFYTGKTAFRYMINVRYGNEMPFYIHIDRSSVKSLIDKFKFSKSIISDLDLRYRIYKPKKI